MKNTVLDKVFEIQQIPIGLYFPIHSMQSKFMITQLAFAVPISQLLTLRQQEHSLMNFHKIKAATSSWQSYNIFVYIFGFLIERGKNIVFIY